MAVLPVLQNTYLTLPGSGLQCSALQGKVKPFISACPVLLSYGTGVPQTQWMLKSSVKDLGHYMFNYLSVGFVYQIEVCTYLAQD